MQISPAQRYALGHLGQRAWLAAFAPDTQAIAEARKALHDGVSHNEALHTGEYTAHGECTEYQERHEEHREAYHPSPRAIAANHDAFHHAPLADTQATSVAPDAPLTITAGLYVLQLNPKMAEPDNLGAHLCADILRFLGISTADMVRWPVLEDSIPDSILCALQQTTAPILPEGARLETHLRAKGLDPLPAITTLLYDPTAKKTLLERLLAIKHTTTL